LRCRRHPITRNATDITGAAIDAMPAAIIPSFRCELKVESRSTDTVAPESLTLSPIRILSPGCEVGERYEVRSVLGMGGSGVVYAVFDRELRRNVALKVLRSDRMTETALKRFRREVAVARDVQSPHLVRVFDMAQSAESIYLTMELIDGESLARRLERGPLSVDEAVDVGTQILVALEALHAIGIVHRDIKPSNVMMTPEGVVKLTDFGLARHVDSETRATETESVVGTYEYVSPEQALGEEIDARSDLYSFGILLFECLTGDVPLRGGSSLGTVIAHVSKPIPDVRSRRADVPRWLGGIVQRLLEKRLAERYQAAADVRRDLARRSSPRWRLSRSYWQWIAASVILIAIGIGVTRYVRGSQFAQLVHDGRIGVRALDARGELLWSHPLLQPGFRSAVVKMGDGSVNVFGIDTDPEKNEAARAHHLSIFDPRTGRVTGGFDLPNLASSFLGFSDTFGVAKMTPVDIDQDGANEVVITYCHHPYYPSYSLIVDPKRRAGYPVFAASGHHRLAGTLDLDGDGRDELIFTGASNRLGWYAGVAAVRVDVAGWDSDDLAIASTPDAAYSLTTTRALLWYALVGKDGYEPGMRVTVDRFRRQIEIEMADHSRIHLDAAGFEAGSSSTRAEETSRAAARLQAYEALRHAIRLSQTGYIEEALLRVNDAVADADRARDGPLGLWTRRVRIGITISAGHDRDVEALLSDVQSRSESPANAYWDAANAFQIRGNLPAALHWYREGLRTVNEVLRGRMSWEFLEGEVFTLAEMKRWDEARQIVRSFNRAFPQSTIAHAYYLAWIDWRATGVFREELPSNRNLVDFSRYVALESSAARPNPDPDALIARIDREMEAVSGVYKPAMLSLKAEMVARKGDRATALALATRALADAKSLWGVEGGARLHTDVVAARLDRLRHSPGGT
jgi:tetratricopeptide (TPR) repeat protein